MVWEISASFISAPAAECSSSFSVVVSRASTGSATAWVADTPKVSQASPSAKASFSILKQNSFDGLPSWTLSSTGTTIPW